MLNNFYGVTIVPTSVALSPYFESFTKEQVNTGRFNNVSEVLRAGLRLLADQEQAQAVKLRELRAAIHAGDESGSGIEANKVFDRLEKKYKSLVKASDQAHACCALSFRHWCRLILRRLAIPSVKTAPQMRFVLLKVCGRSVKR